MKNARTLITALLLAPLAALNAAELYVATNGNDQAAGTPAAPLQTIQSAFNKAGAGDTIVLREGTYRETVALKSKTGKDGAPITLKAYPGEKPVLSGLDVLNLSWEATPQKGIYVAALDAKSVLQLFYNGKPMLEARWPNCPRDTNGDWNFFSPDVWASADTNGNSYGTLVCSALAKTGWDVTGAQALLNVDHQFFSWTRQVKTHSAGSTAFTYDKDLGSNVDKTDEGGISGKWNQKNKFYLFGMRQFLDAPGEWFYDAAAKKLFVHAPDGKNPAEGTLEIKAREWGFAADSSSRYLTVDGICFFGTAIKFGGYNNNSSHIVFRNNTVLYSSWSEYVALPEKDSNAKADQIYPTFEVSNSQVINNTFAYGSLSALYINGFDNLIENNVFHDFCYSSSLKFPLLQVSKAWPVMVGKAGRATIRHNTFYRSGGIQVHCAQEGNEFYLNEIYDSFLACFGGNKDTSALYTYNTYNTFNSGTRFHRNWIYGGYSGTPPVPWGGGIGIRGDDNTSNLTVDHNVIWNLGACGIEIKSPGNPTPEQANRCVNNTVFNHSAYTKVKSAILMASAKQNHNQHSTLANNLADSYYGWWNGKALGKLKLYSNNTASFDPAKQLVNVAWFDFRPAADATNIFDGGVVVEGITGRVVGGAPDIGAYERGDSVYWIPGRRETKAAFPIVPDGAKDVPADRDVLMWRPAYEATSHVVTLSTSEKGLNQTLPQTIQKTFQAEENVFTLPDLKSGTTYFWRVDAVMPDKSVVKGDLWSFKTK